MGWLDLLQGQVVGLDMAPIIYFIEENLRYLEMVDPFFEMVEKGKLTVVTSTVTLLEVLVIPFRQSKAEMADKYRELLFKTRGLEMISLSSSIAEEAAHLRAVHNLRTADAIQVATAASRGASFFLTNDRGLSSVRGLEVLVLDNLKQVP